MNKTYNIGYTARHFRIVYLINANVGYKELEGLIKQNLRIWGGRFNPIVPVENAEISNEYFEILNRIDPDYFFIDRSIDRKKVEAQLSKFNAKIETLDFVRGTIIPGVSTSYLAGLKSEKEKFVVVPDELWKVDKEILNFISINFGIDDSRTSDIVELSKDHPSKELGPDNVLDIFEIVWKTDHLNLSKLSESVANVVAIKPKDVDYRCSQIIISKGKGAINDLLYFWNHKLFYFPESIFITESQLSKIESNEYFTKAINRLFTYQEKFEIVSISLISEELERYRQELKDKGIFKLYSSKNLTQFPYIIDSSSHPSFWNIGEVKTNITIQETALIPLPKLSFESRFDDRRIINWMLDVEMDLVEKGFQKERIRFPTSLETEVFSTSINGRIQRSNNLSFYIDFIAHDKADFDFNVPSNKDIIWNLVLKPYSKNQIKFLKVSQNDDSKRLGSLLAKLPDDVNGLEQILNDSFWTPIIESLSQNLLEIKRTVSFSELIEMAETTLNKNGIVLGDRSKVGWKNIENLEYGIGDYLTEQIDSGVFDKGFVLKCTQCASNYWYYLDEIEDVIECKGCLSEFRFPLEPIFRYKLNDLVRNNICNQKGQTQGNWTVLKALDFLLNRGRNHKSFIYSPQLDLFKSVDTPAIRTAFG